MAVDAKGGSVAIGGARVVVPAGAVPDKRTFRVLETRAIDRQPAEIYGQPVGVEHDVPLAKPVTVRWRLPELSEVQRASLLLVRWDEKARAWQPAPGQVFRVEGDVLVAELTEFSFWDWVANVGQTVGEVTGARKDGPKCSGVGLPSWVRGVVDPDEDTGAAAIRVCFEPDRDEIVTARVVNNRPFAQQLTMSQGGQNWAWTWPGKQGDDLAAMVYSAARTEFDSKTAYLLPPLSEVAVGIGRPAEPGPVVIAAKATVNMITLLVDVGKFAAGQVNIGGTDNPLLNAFLQAVYKCGGKQLLGKPDLRDPAEAVRTVVNVVGGCADEIRRPDSEFGKIFEQLSLTAIQKLGSKGDDLVIKANRFAYQAAGAFKALTFAKVLFYVSDQLQNAWVGPLSFSIRGDGRPQQLGVWSPTCGDIATDADRLYRNLALQDRFRDTSKELWQFTDWAAAATTAVQPLKNCTASYLTGLADRMPGRWADKKAAGVVADKIRALTSSAMDPQVIRFDGIGEFSLRWTVQDLTARGFVNEGNMYNDVNPACVRYAKDGQQVSFSVEPQTGRVLAIRSQGTDQALRTEVGGIHVGSTLTEVRAAFAGYSIEEHLDLDFGQGSNGVIVNGPGGSIGLSLADASSSDYASGQATIIYLNGVGLPGNAPTNSENGC